MTEAATLYLIAYSYQYEGYNGYEWSFEDTEDTAERGYFTSKEDATAWIEAEKQRRIDQGRAKHDEELVRKNIAAEERYQAKAEQDAVRRQEYDALVAAGLDPSFARPAERGPFTPQTSVFDEQVYLRGLRLDWEVIEVNAHETKEES